MLPVAELPMTPLEQAVQDLILDLSEREEPITVEAQAPTSVMIPDVKLLAVPVLAHRVICGGVIREGQRRRAQQIIQQIVDTTRVPR